MTGLRLAPDLDAAAGFHAEEPYVDVGRFDAHSRESRADLAAMIGPVVDGLGEHDARRIVGLRSVRVALDEHGIGIGAGFENSRPGGAVGLRRCPERRDVHLVPIDEKRPVIRYPKQVPAVGADGVAEGLEHRTEGARDGGIELLRGQALTCIKQPNGGPHVVGEGIFEQGRGHWATLAYACPLEKRAETHDSAVSPGDGPCWSGLRLYFGDAAVMEAEVKDVDSRWLHA